MNGVSHRPRDVVFLLDVDNTLPDNDRIDPPVLPGPRPTGTAPREKS
jgi:hypothetical protein